jgi:hypothetical protein
MIIPIDFVAGSHGNFLETILNQYFNIVETGDTFTNTGTSHRKSREYQQNKLFSANHWFQRYPNRHMKQFDKIVSIKFDQDDLLLLSSVSLLRAGDMNIDNDRLEINTRSKLNNQFYSYIIDQIDHAYPFLDRNNLSIPRNVLREFFKFGFRDPAVHGFWIEQNRMQYDPGTKVFVFKFKSFYNIDQLVLQIRDLEQFLDMTFDFSDDFYDHHQKFLSFIPYVNHKQVCDNIIDCVKTGTDIKIPDLSLFQESYINGNLERLYQKEMPFHDIDYCKSTTEMLYYIEHLAPKL